MIAKEINSTKRDVISRQFKERDRLAMENVKETCTTSYLAVQRSENNLAAADAKCEAEMNRLSYRNKRLVCLGAEDKLNLLLNSEEMTVEIVEYALSLLKRFCDTYVMTRVQTICARRALASMTTSLNENKERCRSAINTLSNENKQKFCLKNKERGTLDAIQVICDAFIDFINASTNYKCIAPYLDAMWYPASEEELSEIDANCREAIKTLYGENRKIFCTEYNDTVPARGSLLTREGTIDDKIRDRAVKVVNGVCSLDNAMDKCKNDYIKNDMPIVSVEKINQSGLECMNAVDALGAKDKEKFCSNYEKISESQRRFLQPRIGTRSGNKKILRHIKNTINGTCANFFHPIKKREIDNVMDQVKAENIMNGITEESKLLSLQVTPDFTVRPIDFNNSTFYLNDQPKAANSAQAPYCFCMASAVATGFATLGGVALGITAFWAIKRWKEKDRMPILEEEATEIDTHFVL